MHYHACIPNRLIIPGRNYWNVLAAYTVTSTEGLVFPERDAVILVVPAFMPVKRPPADIKSALFGLSLVHVTLSVTSSIEPSEYVAIALNCWLKPVFKSGGDDGVIATEDNVRVVVLVVDVDADFDEHATVNKTRAVINPNTRQKPSNRICFPVMVILPLKLNKNRPIF
jgi:hypothetical protein